MLQFDLIEYQNMVKQQSTPGQLFKLWDAVCTKYDRKEIGKYELEEMKASVDYQFLVLASLEDKALAQ